MNYPHRLFEKNSKGITPLDIMPNKKESNALKPLINFIQNNQLKLVDSNNKKIDI